MLTKDIQNTAAIGHYAVVKLPIVALDGGAINSSLKLGGFFPSSGVQWVRDANVLSIEKADDRPKHMLEPVEQGDLCVRIDTIDDDRVYDVVHVRDQTAWVRDAHGSNCFFQTSALRRVPSGTTVRPKKPIAVGDIVKVRNGGVTYVVEAISRDDAWTLRQVDNVHYTHRLDNLVLA